MMRTSALRSRRTVVTAAVPLALIAALVAVLPAAAFDGGWTKPKRIFAHSSPPNHTMVTDTRGKVHVASERGSSGVWYITNQDGSWTDCRVSDGDDRRPSIAVDGDVVHIAFARLTDGQEGIYTASSDQSQAGSGCGWAETKRYDGAATYPALGARAGILSIAFRTPDKKLRFFKGAAGTDIWTVKEVIDGKCCTSPVSLALTSAGAPRVAYGDGTSRAEGLKFGVRTPTGWKKSKVHGGRVKQVSLTLDQTPGLFGGGPSNAPRIAYVVKKKGTYLGSKSNAGATGAWGKRSISKAFGPPSLTHHTNATWLIYAKNGDLAYARAGGPIWTSGKLSGGGTDSRPRLDSGQLTFSRKSGATGIYYSRKR